MMVTWWLVNSGNREFILKYYHFGSVPRFPTWYMGKEKVNSIKMLDCGYLWNNIRNFKKCFNQYCTTEENIDINKTGKKPMAYALH